MVHAYVIFCMVLNATMCFRYEIMHEDLMAITSPMDCMKGGATFAAWHGTLTIGGVQYENRGGVRCELDPPRVTDIQRWLDEQRARATRLEPQIK